MSVQRGDVVMVNWPYSDRTGSKVRPALVVQVDSLNNLIADTVLVSITKTSRGATSTEVVIDPVVDTQSGLRYRSVASCNNLMTIDQTLINRTIGTLTGATMRQVESCLKTALGLP
jgi:mRNA interferase MazF